MNYAALQVKSCYSILDSLNDISKITQLAAEYGYQSLAITDIDNMFGVMEFYNACKKNKIKPIIGINISKYNILLYAKNNKGYKNLIKLSTIIETGELQEEDLKKYCDNLILIMPFSFYQKDIYNIYEEKYIGFSTIEERNQIDKPKVFINDVSYPYQEDYKYLDYAKMIKEGKILGEYVMQQEKGKHLLTIDELKQIATPEDLTTIKNIASSCNVEIDYTKGLTPIYDESIDCKEYLKTLTNKGLAKRLNNEIPKEYQERLDYELSIINKMGFNDYFLIVYDYVLYAKKHDILVGPGRGSAAGSLVSYTLGITDVDPIKYGLLFERFLNIERVTMPDIDIDFDASKREEVIKYVIDKYGRKKVAGIITFNTLGAKQVIRDVGRILKISSHQIDSLARMIKKDQTIKETFEKSKDFQKVVLSTDILKKLYDISCYLEGLPRHISVHAAGIVMSKYDLDETVPLYKNYDDMYVTQYNKNYLESLGLLKMDFLSLSNLTMIDSVIKSIRKEEKLNITFQNIPLDDPETMNLFAKGLTDDIFQFESTGMKDLLKKLNPKNFYDIVIALALYRPGPMDEIDEFIKKRNNKVKIEWDCEALVPILKDTYGTIIYQEQIMEIAKTIAGFSLGEADILRNAMSKKKEDILLKEKAQFIEGSIANGYSEEFAEKTYNLILKFANYGLNKSHAVSYAIVSYKMAFLKTHFYKYFTIALLNENINNKKLENKYITGLRQKNIKITPPNILESTNGYYLKNGEIICPFNIINNLETRTIRDIILERENKPFISFIDFARRLSKKITKKELESLIISGVFDTLGYNKKTLINNLPDILNYTELCNDNVVLEEPIILSSPEYSKEELIKYEFMAYGFYLTNHPVTKYRMNNLNTLQLEKYNGKYISLTLEVTNIKEVITKKNDVMAFIDASDEFAQVGLTLFPKEYKMYNKVKIYDIINVYGKVEKRFDDYQIIVTKLEILNK